MHKFAVFLVLALAVTISARERCYTGYVWQNNGWICKSRAKPTAAPTTTTTPPELATESDCTDGYVWRNDRWEICKTRSETTKAPKTARQLPEMTTKTDCVNGYAWRNDKWVICRSPVATTNTPTTTRQSSGMTTMADCENMWQNVLEIVNGNWQRCQDTMRRYWVTNPPTKPTDNWFKTSTVEQITPKPSARPEFRVENDFIPMTPRPRDSAYCCSTGPYNVTRQHTYTEENRVPHVASRQVIHGIRDRCPSYLWPARPTVEDCYFYRQETYMDYRTEETQVTRYTTQEYYCRSADIDLCCAGYLEFNGQCIRVAKYNEWMRLLGQPTVDPELYKITTSAPSTTDVYEISTTDQSGTTFNEMPTTRPPVGTGYPETVETTTRSMETSTDQKTTQRAQQVTPPAPRVEQVFIPAQHPTNSRYCCRTGPYNVTRQHAYTEDVRVPHVASRQVVDGIRDFCPSAYYPDRLTVEDCYYYKQQTYMDYQTLSRQVTRYTTEEYYCRVADLTECCQGYIKYNDDCLSRADYTRLMSLMRNFGRR